MEHNYELKPNSHAYKENQKKKESNGEAKKVEKVVSGNVKVQKKSDARKFADVFISEDAANVKSYILMDVLVPAIKKAVSDIVTDGINMILYGETKRSSKNSSGVSYISYNKYSDHRDDRSYSSGNRASTYSFNNIKFDSRGDAESVLERMGELLEVYNMVSVADLYDLVGVTGNYTDNKYGWTNLNAADIIRTRDGYLLKMPSAKPL